LILREIPDTATTVDDWNNDGLFDLLVGNHQGKV